MSNYTEDLRKFQLLGLDVTDLEEKAAALVAVDKALTDARRQLITYKPADKDYRENMTKAAGLINALEVSKSAALDDVRAAVDALKTKALEVGAPGLPQAVGKIRELDKRAVNLLLQLREVLHERDQATTQADDTFSIVAEFARERGEDPGGVSWAMPGGDRWPGAGKALEVYTRRFISMLTGGTPGAGEDPLQWFSRRRW